jgi:hypothetical protein
MTSLYQISQEYQAVTELEDVDAQTLADTLEALAGEFDNKAVALIQHTFNVNSDVEAIDREIHRLKSMKAQKEAFVERLREYLKENMQRCGIPKIAHPLFTITLIKPRKMVKIVDEKLIPDEYVEVEVVSKPKKKELLESLKGGATIPGVELTDSEPGLMIK